MPVWNSKAINYDYGVEIYEPETGRVFTEEEAKEQPPEVRRRLCTRGRVIGKFVMTADESRELLNKRLEHESANNNNL